MIGRLKRDLEQLGNIGKDARGGVARPTFSQADLEARSFLIELMGQAGLHISTDAAANIIGIRAGRQKSPLISTGSHIDTGIMWGIFDGPLGVIGGIESIRMMNDENITTDLPIAIMCFTDEEGTYLSLAGSKFFSGALSKEELYRTTNKYDGSKFGDLVPRALKNGIIERFTTPIKSHIELHIEQGPILEKQNLQIGILSGIVGIRWINLTLKGQQAHAGATPMNLRRDPTIPASNMILEVRHIALSFKDMVGTCGVIKVTPNVINAIPREVHLGVDLRSLDRKELDIAAQQVIENSKKAASEENCELEYSISEAANPAIFSRNVISVIKDATVALGYSHTIMPSRAGHDTQNLANQSEVGMIFVPSKGGISHAPEEWTEFEQAHNGVEVLKKSLTKLATVH